ncbi:MAG: PAS domain S-box protein, partial [Alphaproteobacteria bacterium]|nr:PAS domain S-box protein [Alphaproteobacteria bacterium]
GRIHELEWAGSETAHRLRALANAVELKFSGEIASLSEDGEVDRRNRPQTATLDHGIANLTAGLPAVNVRIFRLDGLAVYSSDRVDVGVPRQPDPAIGKAFATGESTFRYSPRGPGAADRGLREDHDWMEAVIPVRTDTGKVSKVLEVVTNVSAQIDGIERAARNLILSLLAAIGFAYVVMTLLVVRADRVLSRQYRDLQDAGENLELQNQRLQQEVEERKRTEEALTVAEMRKAFILETALEAVITVDDRQLTVEYNDAARKIFGYDKDEVLGRDIGSLIVPEDRREQHAAAFARYLKDGVGTGKGHPFQVAGVRKSGEEVPLQIAITSFLLGGRRYFTAVMHDITDRLQAEKMRDEGERTLLDVIEASPVAIGITDHAGRLLYWNTQFFKMGRNIRDANGNRAFGLVFERPDFHPALLARARAGGRVLNEEARLRLSDDTDAWVLVSMKDMMFEGNPAILTWLYDITTLKLQEQALREARNDAEKASRAKSDFLATMSHEIRTPMNGVVAMSEILDQTDLSDGQRAMTTIIRDSAAVLLAIIDDVLDFSKIEAGKLDLVPGRLSLAQTVEGVVDLLGTRSAEKGLELIAHLDPDVPDHLLGDAVRIRQVLLNLVGNAIKFTGKGHVLAEVTMLGQRGDVAELLFRVVDTGPGIAPELHDHLFKPFVQADSSAARRFGGTGLGLSICKTLVELMGGSIGLDSVPGEGATFWFRLSLPVLNERRVSSEEDLGGLRVLLATAVLPQARALRGYLTAAGASVAETSTVPSTIAALREAAGSDKAFDVVLVDNQIGETSGLNLARDIVEAVGKKGPPVVLVLPKMAAFSFMNSSHDAVFTTLSKPVRREALCRVVALAAGRVVKGGDALPARREDDKARLARVPPSPEEALARGSLILVAEDNPTNQTVIRMLLERLGFAADMAENGSTAWAMLQQRAYGLLLTDCHMPEVDGFQLARMVRDGERERGARTRLPIIALTADAISGTAERCTDAGMDGYLKKPVSWNELDTTIRKWLPDAVPAPVDNTREAEAPPPSPPPPPPPPPPSP